MTLPHGVRPPRKTVQSHSEGHVTLPALAVTQMASRRLTPEVSVHHRVAEGKVSMGTSC